MKKIYILFISLLTLLSCKKDEEINNQNPLNITKGGNEQGEFGEIIYNDNVIVLNEITKEKIIEINENYILFQNSRSFDILKNGDVLFSGKSNISQNGFARIITDIKNINSNLKILTVQANANDVFNKASVHQSFSPDFNKIENLDLIDKKINFSKNGKDYPSTNLSFNYINNRIEIVFKIDFDHNFSTTKDQIAISGYIEYHTLNNMYLDYNYNTLFPQYSYFHLNGSSKIVKGIEITYGGKKSVDFDYNDFADISGTNNVLNKDFRLLSIPLTASSPTNLVISPKIVFYSKISLDVNGKLSIDFNNEFSFNYSANWNITNSNGIWNRSFQKFNETTNNFIPSMSGELNLNFTPIKIGVIVEFPQFLLSGNENSHIGFFIYPYSRNLNATANYNISNNCFKFDLIQKQSFSVNLEGNLNPLFSGWDLTLNIPLITLPWSQETNIINYIKCFNVLEPTLSTNSITNISQNSATSGGNISSDGGSSITSKGVCWSTSQNPTTSNFSTNDGSGSGSFTSTLSGLTPNTTYYVRAYAINSIGTSYGNQQSFTTLSNTNSIPSISTNSISNIFQNSATSGGSISSNGGSTITSKGVCWSTSQNPTTSNYSTSDGSGSGSFTSTLSGLTSNTTYYVRAYASNSIGTAYGNQRSFTTLSNSSNISINVSPSSLNFGNVNVGNSSSQNITIQNTGNQPLVVNGVYCANAYYYSNYSGTIPVGSSQQVSVTFNPNYTGTLNSQLTVSSNATSGNNIVNLYGYGVNSSSCNPIGNPTIGYYGSCESVYDYCGYRKGIINAEIVSVNCSTHQITFEFKKCDGSAFSNGGTLSVISDICSGINYDTYILFSGGEYSHQITITDNNMSGTKTYYLKIQQNAGNSISPPLQITY